MATRGWGTDRPLTETLFTEGHRFSFYQAVKLMEIVLGDKIPVGEGSDPKKETIRFESMVGIEFPAGDIDDISPPDGDPNPARMTVNLMGLAGNHGPMPMVYTELIMERAWRRDRALKAFFDIFNHRLISLLYRVRKICRLGFDFKSPRDTPVAGYLFSLMGLGTDGLQSRMHARDRSLLHYTSLLGQQPRSMAGLEYMLVDHFKAPVRGVQFCGQWHAIAEDQVTRLGSDGQNQQLGIDTVLGGRVWDQQGKFELHVGPLDAERFVEFLPFGGAFTPLCELTRFYVGNELDFDIVVIPRTDDAPAPGLGGAAGPRLGWTSWLGSRRGEKSDYEQVRLSPRLISGEGKGFRR
jgi:type VI secretion system protein ImpH